ncbi:MAG TPA: DNA gyrase inhibitor YacG [Acidisarcina sp.]
MNRSEAKTKHILRCPTCRKIVLASEAHFPFCSDHCRQVDLGKWATGVYRISSPILDPEVLEGLDADTRPKGEDESY